MLDSLTHNQKSIALAITGFGFFAIADCCAKWLSDYYWVGQVISVSSLFSLIFMLFIAKYLGGLKQTLQTKKRRIHCLRGLCHAIISFLVVLAFSKLPFAQTYTLFFISPFIATILSIPLFKEKVSTHGWISIILGFIGVLVILRPGFGIFNPWLLLPLLSAFFISTLFLLAKTLGSEETPLSLAFYPIVTTLIVSTAYSIPFFTSIELMHMPIYILQGITLTFGMIGVAGAFRMGKSAIVSPFHYTQIIWAVILGYLVFAEKPDIWTLIGGIIIIGSGIYLIKSSEKP